MQDKHKASLAEIEARRRAWVIGELMRDDPDLSRGEAEALYDEAGREAVPRGRQFPTSSKRGVL